MNTPEQPDDRTASSPADKGRSFVVRGDTELDPRSAEERLASTVPKATPDGPEDDAPTATTLPAPPPWAMPKVKTQASNAFGTPGIGPISGLPSGA